MIVLTTPLETMSIYQALALEEIAFERVRRDRSPVLRFWRTLPRALTIGRFQCVRGEVDVDLAREMGIPVVRRMSGGGAVFNDGEGEFCFSLTAPAEFLPGGITGAYGKVLEWIDDSLRGLGIDTYIAGTSIFLRDVGKVSGSSMRWSWDTVQVHGTILHSMDATLMKRLLWGGRFGCSDGTPSIRKEVAPLGDIIDMTLEDLHARIADAILPGTTRSELVWTDEEMSRAITLVDRKYSQDDWNMKL